MLGVVGIKVEREGVLITAQSPVNSHEEFSELSDSDAPQVLLEVSCWGFTELSKLEKTPGSPAAPSPEFLMQLAPPGSCPAFAPCSVSQEWAAGGI